MNCKRQNILIFLTCMTITTAMLGDQEQQLGYWQRFKNWLSGTTIPYEWAKNYVAGLTREQKEALMMALGVTTIGLMAQKQKGYTPEGIGVSLAAGAVGGTVALYARPYIEKSLQRLIQTEVDRIKKSMEGLTKEEKLLKLDEMYYSDWIEDKTPDSIKLRAINIIRSELRQ